MKSNAAMANPKDHTTKNFQNELVNLLPIDGTVCYYGRIFSPEEAAVYMQLLLNDIAWKHDEVIIFGRKITTKRKTAWYGDQLFEYRYSGITRLALPWTHALLKLKTIVEQHCGERFNSCLLNLYHNGSEGMAWHSDDEKQLLKDGAIASLSFGTTRKFELKHKISGELVSTRLEPGSLLVMKGSTQTHWRHRLPPAKRIGAPRINLTFRTIVS